MSASAEKRDILIIGATGFTGRLILKYLASKRTTSSFTLGIAGRSTERLRQVAAEAGLKENEDVKIIKVDVHDDDDVRSVVKDCRVVVSAVGPFWNYGKKVVAACAELGVHYVDITGETHFIRWCIDSFHELAKKNGTIILNGGGLDSVPSDISAFLGVQALRQHFGPQVQAGQSTSAFHLSGLEPSGGSLATVLNAVSGAIPKSAMKARKDDYALSPVRGVTPRPSIRPVYYLPFTNIVGGFFPLGPGNIHVVRRTWGLFSEASGPTPSKDSSYGPTFDYQEFRQTKSRLSAFKSSFSIFLGIFLLAWAPFRYLAKNFILKKPGEGPPESEMENGWMRITNITVDAEDQNRAVKNVIMCRGEPGYFLTSVIAGEIAISLLPSNISRLTDIGKRGGVLTSMTAFGSELVDRLKATGRFEFENEVVSSGESRKTR